MYPVASLNAEHVHMAFRYLTVAVVNSWQFVDVAILCIKHARAAPPTIDNLLARLTGSSTKSFRPEAKKKGGWVKTILEKSPFIEKIVQAFLGVSDLFLTRYVCNFYYHVH